MTQQFKIFLLVISTMLLGLHSQAQEVDKNTTWTRLKTDTHHMTDGFVYVLKSPTRWRGKDWLKLGGVVGGVYLVSLADRPFYNWVSAPKYDERRRKVGLYSDITGKPGPSVIIFSVVYGLGVTLDKQWMRDSGILMFGALASTTFLQTISKTVAGRARPDSGTDSNFHFEPFNKDPAFHSFPSGHTMASLTITSVLAQQVESKLAKIGLYSIGISTGFARAYSGSHWLSDVALSGAITYLAVKTTTKRYRQRQASMQKVAKKTNIPTLELTPAFRGLSLTYKF